MDFRMAVRRMLFTSLYTRDRRGPKTKVEGPEFWGITWRWRGELNAAVVSGVAPGPFTAPGMRCPLKSCTEFERCYGYGEIPAGWVENKKNGV